MSDVPYDFSGRVFVVTGATGGIGHVVVARAAAAGARVFAVGRDRVRLDRLCVQIDPSGRQVSGVTADSTCRQQVASAAREIAAEVEGVDVLVNAAAPASKAPASRGLADLDEHEFLAQFDVKVLGYLRFIQELFGLLQHAHGAVVDISGTGWRQTTNPVTAVRNVAVVALTKSIADLVRGSGVRLNVLHPGITLTPGMEQNLRHQAQESKVGVDEVIRDAGARTTRGELTTVDELVDVLFFLASDQSRALNGSVVDSSGGQYGSIVY